MIECTNPRGAAAGRRVIETGAISMRTEPALPEPGGSVLARLGSLEVRLAATPQERRSAFALRYDIFCRQMGARLAGADPVAGIETDRFDAVCDHIIVCDRAQSGPAGPKVVGTYRALRPEAAVDGYYSQAEFDIAPLLARHAGLRFCEVGRSCVAPSHRSMRGIEALWCGLWAYAALHGIDAYFGAASFVGTDPCDHALPLSFLHHHVGAPKGWQVAAHPAHAVSMDLLPRSAIDPQAAQRALPPLIRGYMRVNAHVGETAFIDRHFGTTDVMIVTPLRAMPHAYRRRFTKVTGLGLDPVVMATDMQ